MAITIQDYKYVHNTLDKGRNRIDDGTLKIGARVNNLVPELNQDNVYNEYYGEYYGDRPLNEVWSSDRGGTTTDTGLQKKSFSVFPLLQTINILPSGSKVITYYAKGRLFLGRYKQYDNNNSEYDIKWSRSSDNPFNPGPTQPNRDSVIYDGNTGYIDYTLYSESLKQINGTFDYYNTNPDNNETINKGKLTTSTTLKPNTTYVLQIINAAQGYNDLNTIPNNLIALNGLVCHFNSQYFFFSTQDSSSNITASISIEGLSFGYEIYQNKNGEISQLRSFKSPEQAKVFLFESNMPWVVDKNGVIVSLNNNPLITASSSSTTPLSASLTTDDIKNIFSQTPEIQIENKTLKIVLPESTDGMWKYDMLWNATYASSSKPAIMDQLCLLTYRNFLTDEVRDYNKVDRTVQYGLLRGIQQTYQNQGDIYGRDTHNFSMPFEQIIFPTYTQLSPITLSWSTESLKHITFSKGSKIPIELWKLPLLGYNYAYSKKKQFAVDLKYKYTSISFAWGWKSADGKYYRLSEYSKPIIIDRSLTKVNDFTQSTTTIDINFDINTNIKISETNNNQYYPSSAIFIDKI